MFPTPEWLKPILISESLPSGFSDLVHQHFIPIAEKIASWHGSEPLVIGINGAQGTGKSTLSLILAHALKEEFGKSSAVISIDDIYHTKAKRAELATDTHPLFLTRGVPGTHDVQMGISVIKALKNKEVVAIPSFNKATDDRRTEEDWETINDPVDIIIFEGWCIGAQPQSDDNLANPMNSLEEIEDPNQVWRKHVNQELKTSYTELFSLIDKLIMIKAPSMECILEWRSQQEEKLRARTEDSELNSGIMNTEQIKRFIMHYERLTRCMLVEMPQRADILIELNTDHTIHQTSIK